MNDKKTIIAQLVLATESINEAMEKLTDLYPSKDDFVKKTVKYVAEVLLGEASRITTFWADELVDEARRDIVGTELSKSLEEYKADKTDKIDDNRIDDFIKMAKSLESSLNTSDHWREQYLKMYTDTHQVARELDREVKRLTATEEKYYELLNWVESKHEGETRHETALRYIKEREDTQQSCGETKEGVSK